MVIEWNKLKTCDGHSNPNEIPMAIENLFSDNKEIRKKGYWGIDNHVVVQSDLYDSAPYAARLIVDKLLSNKLITIEVVKILSELYNGYGQEILHVGPLSGRRIDELCKEIIHESESYLSSSIGNLSGELADEVNNLLRVLSG